MELGVYNLKLVFLQPFISWPTLAFSLACYLGFEPTPATKTCSISASLRCPPLAHPISKPGVDFFSVGTIRQLEAKG